MIFVLIRRLQQRATPVRNTDTQSGISRCLNPVAEERPTPAEIMQHPLVEHYSQFVVGEDPEFAEWIRATLHRMRSEVDAAAVAAAKASSPVPGSFPPGGFA
jgi:hypothetical protein